MLLRLAIFPLLMLLASIADVGAEGVFSVYLALVIQLPRFAGENLNN